MWISGIDKNDKLNYSHGGVPCLLKYWNGSVAKVQCTYQTRIKATPLRAAVLGSVLIDIYHQPIPQNYHYLDSIDFRQLDLHIPWSGDRVKMQSTLRVHF